MNATLVLGVDIGGTRSKYGLVDVAAGQVVQQVVRPTAREDEARFLAELRHACAACCRAAGVDPADVVGVGIGVPGYTRAGLVESTWGFLPFMEAYPLVRLASEALGCPCRIDNDARLVALAESRYGAARGYHRALTLTLGTGVGFGFTVDGQLDAPDPRAHMAGHFPIRDDAPPCYCGIVGCFEQLASASGLDAAVRDHAAQLAQREGTAWQDLPALFDAEQVGHPVARRIVAEYVDNLARGLTAYGNILTPDAIVLGGGVSKSLPPYLPRIRAQMRAHPFEAYHCDLICSQMQEQGGILGAAALYDERLLS